MIRTVVKRAMTKGSQSSAFHSTEEPSVFERIFEFQIIYEVATGMLNGLAFTFPVAKIIKDEVKNRFFETAEPEKRFNNPADAANEKKNKEEDAMLTKKMDSTRSSSHF